MLRNPEAATPAHTLLELASSHRSKGNEEINWRRIFGRLSQHYNPAFPEYITASDDEGCTLLHYACSQGDKRTAFIRTEELIKFCKYYGFTSQQITKFVNEVNREGNTALQLAKETLNKPLVKLLLENGADIVTIRQNGPYAADMLFDDILKNIYDDAVVIENREAEKDNQCAWEFTWNFDPVTSNFIKVMTPESVDKNLNQTRNLTLLLQENTASKRVILQHPLVRVFLHFKERKFTLLLYLSMLYHIIWSAVTFVYIFCNTHILDSTNIVNTSRDSNLTELCQSFKMFDGHSPTEFLTSWVFYFVLLLYISSMVKEGMEFVLSEHKLHYLSQLGNLGQWLVNLTVFIVWVVNVIIRLDGEGEESFLERTSVIWKIYLPSIYIFGMFASLLLIQVELGKTKWLGTHIEMFVYGFHRVFQFLLAFLPLLTAFLFTFHLLMPMRSSFVPSWGLGFAKILAMMTGEVDYDDTFYGDDEDEIAFRNVLKIFVLIFIVIIVILLQNLLIARNVSDGAELSKKSDLRNIESKLEEIYLMETFLTRPWVIRLMARLSRQEKWYTDWYERNLIVDQSDYKRRSIPKGWRWFRILRAGESGDEVLRLSDYPYKLRKVIKDWIEETLLKKRLAPKAGNSEMFYDSPHVICSTCARILARS